MEQKIGHKLDGNTNEKITDGVRGLYEKMTGYICSLTVRGEDAQANNYSYRQKVNPKFSN